MAELGTTGYVEAKMLQLMKAVGVEAVLGT